VNLADKRCIPCTGDVPPLSLERARELLSELGDGWQLDANGHLSRQYEFRNFGEALDFANSVGEIAEDEAHHPDLYVAWGKCRVDIWTHKISGLTESDFYLAAKVSRAFQD